MNLECRGNGVCIEVRVVTHVELYVTYFLACEYEIAISDYALTNSWENLDASTTIMEFHHGYYVPALTGIHKLLPLLGSALVSDGDMPAEARVYITHHLPKDLSVSTRILNAVVVYIIMYHLMNDSIFDFGFGQIHSCTYPEAEIIFLNPAE